MHHRSVMFVAVGTAALTLFTGGAAAAGGPRHLAPQAATSGTLVIDTAFDLATADPGRMFEFTGQIVDRALYSTLLTYSDDNLVLQPQLASSYSVSDGGDRYTFTLNPKAVFSDGEAGDGRGRRVFVPAPAKPTGEPVVPARRHHGIGARDQQGRAVHQGTQRRHPRDRHQPGPGGARGECRGGSRRDRLR